MWSRPVLLASIGIFATAPLAAPSFEGNISMTVSGSDGKTIPITYKMKDGKIRIDQSTPNGDQIAMVLDMSAQKMLMIMSSRRMYMERDFDASAGVNKAMAEKHATVTRTGRMETIAGYKCEHVTIANDDGSTDACVTSDLGAAFRMPMGGSPMAPPNEPAWSTQLGRGVFPLKVTKGNDVVMVVTNIEKKPVDAALFAPPDGFQKFTMPAMPGGTKRPDNH